MSEPLQPNGIEKLLAVRDELRARIASPDFISGEGAVILHHLAAIVAPEAMLSRVRPELHQLPHRDVRVMIPGFDFFAAGDLEDNGVVLATVNEDLSAMLSPNRRIDLTYLHTKNPRTSLNFFQTVEELRAGKWRCMISIDVDGMSTSAFIIDSTGDKPTIQLKEDFTLTNNPASVEFDETERQLRADEVFVLDTFINDPSSVTRIFRDEDLRCVPRKRLMLREEISTWRIMIGGINEATDAGKSVIVGEEGSYRRYESIPGEDLILLETPINSDGTDRIGQLMTEFPFPVIDNRTDKDLGYLLLIYNRPLLPSQTSHVILDHVNHGLYCYAHFRKS